MSCVRADRLLTPTLVLDTFGFQSGDSVLIRRNSDLFASYLPNPLVYTSPEVEHTECIYSLLAFTHLCRRAHQLLALFSVI